MSKFFTDRIGELSVMLVVFWRRGRRKPGGGSALRDNHDGAIDASQRIALPVACEVS
jgi:hypothetical protein